MIQISKTERIRLQNLIYEWKRQLYAPEYALSVDNNYGEIQDRTYPAIFYTKLWERLRDVRNK